MQKGSKVVKQELERVSLSKRRTHKNEQEMRNVYERDSCAQERRRRLTELGGEGGVARPSYIIAIYISKLNKKVLKTSN